MSLDVHDERGDPGVLDPAGEEGPEEDESSRETRILEQLLLSMVMERETTGTCSDDGIGPESYRRNFFRPFSGLGPASVSSQKFSRRPIIPRQNDTKDDVPDSGKQIAVITIIIEDLSQ